MVHMCYHSCVAILQIEYETRNQACVHTNTPSYQKQYHSTLGACHWRPQQASLHRKARDGSLHGSVTFRPDQCCVHAKFSGRYGSSGTCLFAFLTV